MEPEERPTWSDVFALVPGITAAEKVQMWHDVRKLSRDTGYYPPHVVRRALCEALTAGVPPDQVFEYLERAIKAWSIGGVR